MSKVRVLCLDGGGIKGAFTASVIATIEKMTSRRFVDHFDLIVGTSTGGIIAAALSLGTDSEKLVKLYETQGPKLFPVDGVLGAMARGRRWLFGPKHDAAVLREFVSDAVGAKKLGEAKTRLVIPSYSAEGGDLKLFKTAHHERFRHDYQLLAADVMMATAAAPTYFKAHDFGNGQTFLDGGVWANCPALVGVIEAIAVLEAAPASVSVLSIGTTEEPFAVPRKQQTGGMLRWYKSHELFLQAQAKAALAQAYLLAGEFHRVSRVVARKRFALDSAKQVKTLIGLGLEVGTHECEAVKEKFLGQPVERFEPVHPL